jgi:hypothetical protein
MRSLWRNQAAGTLSATAALWFEPRPAEALYDLAGDPWEINNLAADPDHLGTLTRLRMAYAEWRLRIPDLADEDEAALAERYWPGGEQPITEAPSMIEQPDGTLLVSGTAGASIEIDSGSGWQLYDGAALPPPAGKGSLKARAVRYGHALSDEVVYPAASGAGSEATPSR